jgi:hypothetical protein
VDLDALLKSLEAWSFAAAIREGLYLFPLFESIHVIGLAMVFGTIFILDLRMLGVASMARPFERVTADILKWTWLGFAITIITGALMFTTNASVYYHNTYFRVKMLLLLLAGVNMGIFESTLGRSVATWGRDAVPPARAKLAARLSLVIWISVIVTGRLIGFTTSRVAVSAPDVNMEQFLEADPFAAPSPASNPTTK